MTSSKEDSLKINTKTMIIVLYINKFTKSLQFFCCSGHATKINKGGSAFQKVKKLWPKSAILRKFHVNEFYLLIGAYHAAKFEGILGVYHEI